MKFVDVIVVAYNEENTISTSLHSIAGQKEVGVFFQVTIVPNGCTDKTAQVAKDTIAKLQRRPDMSFKVIESEESGKNRSLNFAIERTTAPLIFCVDADVTLSHDCFALVLKSFDDPRIQVSGAEPDVIIDEALRGTLLGDIYRVRQLRRDAVGARLAPFGSFMAFRRSLNLRFPEDFVGADNTWLAFEVARAHGWDAVTVAEGSKVFAVPPPNWLDFVKQGSRWDLNLKHLLDHFPEFIPISDERDGRRTVKRLLTSSRRTEVLRRMREEEISPQVLEICEFIPRVLHDNASLMASKLARADGTWEAIASTKR